MVCLETEHLMANKLVSTDHHKVGRRAVTCIMMVRPLIREKAIWLTVRLIVRGLSSKGHNYTMNFVIKHNDTIHGVSSIGSGGQL